ncbi:MAG: hypothetical protein JXJ20_00500 [Anaerolineae bacterium]|jgi:hypothetical protein|nr:hypothetical protein [Anaerolineae bacterium]
MRHYYTLDITAHDESDGTLLIKSSQPSEPAPALWFGREGMYISVSATYGPLEIALRPRLNDLLNTLKYLRPTERLSVTRRIGTGQAQVELGLAENGELLLRATIVADATGYIAMNFILTSDVRQTLYEWLGVEVDAAV